jgi:type I restriction enzyme, S subunit
VSEVLALGDVADVVAGVGFPKDMQGGQDGAIPVFKVGDISAAWLQGKSILNDSRNYLSAEEARSLGKCVPAGATVFAKIGEALRLNRRVMLGRDALVDNNVMGLVPKREKVAAKYLYYFMQTVDLGELSRSTTVPSIRKSDVVEIGIPVPGLAVQDEIVVELEKQFSRLDEAVANLQRVKANLKRYKASVLKAAVEGRLVETEATLASKKRQEFESATALLLHAVQGRRLKAFNAPEQGFAALPDGWTWASVEQLAANDANSIGAGPFGTIFKAKDFRSEGVPIIFLRHVSPLKYLTHKPGFMDVGKWEELFQPYSVFGGELLITKLGEPPGVCAQYPVGIGPAMVTPDVIKLSVNSEVANSEYLMYYFNSDPAKRFATGAAFGTTRTRLTLPLFREMPVPLPPLVEQVRIVAEVDRHLSIIREVEAEVDANLKRAQALRQATLAKAFS